MDVVQELVAVGARSVVIAVRDPSRRAVVRSLFFWRKREREREREEEREKNSTCPLSEETSIIYIYVNSLINSAHRSLCSPTARTRSSSPSTRGCSGRRKPRPFWSPRASRARASSARAAGAEMTTEATAAASARPSPRSSCSSPRLSRPSRRSSAPWPAPSTSCWTRPWRRDA